LDEIIDHHRTFLQNLIRVHSSDSWSGPSGWGAGFPKWLIPSTARIEKALDSRIFAECLGHD
jgi:hypothetical protein